MTDPVAEPNEEYVSMAPFWQLTSALRGGTHEMRAAGKDYLPQEPDEKAAQYENRLNRSVLTNLYRKTADKLVGKPLKKPIIINEDVPPEIKPMLDDMDSLGTRLDVFAKEVLTQAVDDGLTHILVEFPDTENEEGEFVEKDGRRFLSLRQVQEKNIRPYAKHVLAGDLIGWKSELVNGVKTLTQIRIMESAKQDADDEFTQNTLQHIRVIERDRWRLYEKQKQQESGTGEKKEWFLIDEGQNTLGEIALVTLYTNQLGFMLARPWLEDIAHLNVAHWQSDSDQRNLLHIARVPILFAKGFGDEDTQFQFSIGSNTFLKGPSSSSLEYVEHSGHGITSGRDDLKDIEERIGLLGMETTIKKTGLGANETATGKAIDSADANSSLGMVSQELENALEGVLAFFAKWLELGDNGGSLSVFKDFGIDMADVGDIDMLLKARQAGEISQVTFLKELKRRSLLADDFDPQTEIDLLDIESAGSATSLEEDDIDPLTGKPTGEPKEVPGRNKVGDMTSEIDGHRHVLEEGGKTSKEQDDEGMSHAHTWDELAIQTSVDEGHSHVLLERSASTKAPAPVIPEPQPGDSEDDDKAPLFGKGDKSGDEE